MTKEREALNLALDAFGEIAWSNETQWQRDRAKEAITVIKEALANVATNDTSQERVDKTSESVHEPWSPVSIGVDVTEEGAHVVGIYALDNDTSQIFYSKFYPAPQRKPLTENEIKHLWYEACQTNLELTSQLIVHLARNIEAAHGIKENI